MGGGTHGIDLLRRASRVAAGESEKAVVAGTGASGLSSTLLATAVHRRQPAGT